MADYIDVEKRIYIPLKPLTVNFHEKEEVELNAFQRFILEAIEENATLEQIEDATQLPENVIESEISHMQRLNLLNKDCTLSELSKNILMISRCLEILNNEKKKLCICLITGELEEYVEDNYYNTGQDDWVMEGEIRFEDISEISTEDKDSILADSLSALSGFSEEQINKVRSSVYVELNETDKKIVYKQQKINKLPCLIGDNKLKSEDKIYAEGKFSVITVEVSNDSLEKYSEKIAPLKELYTDAPEFISDFGKNLIKEYKQYEDYKNEKLTFAYDHTSGMIKEEKYDTDAFPDERVQLTLKADKEIDDKVKSRIFDAVKSKWKLDEKYQVKTADVKEERYIVGFCLEELRGDIYADR
ncbi:MAG: hypothetical protein HDR03_05850 [Lachnospiraceae bacterium]|nr:hypothetical protein [Lachnospiraceae bacterium]